MCSELKSLGIILMLTLAAVLVTAAQEPVPSATPTDDEVRTRVKQLEQQVDMMRRELAELKGMVAKNSVPAPGVTAKTESMPVVP